MMKCPHCKQPIDHVLLEEIEVHTTQQRTQGWAYLCPSCRSVISVHACQAALREMG